MIGEGEHWSTGEEYRKTDKARMRRGKKVKGNEAKGQDRKRGGKSKHKNK